MRTIHAFILGISLCRPVYADPAPAPTPEQPQTIAVPWVQGQPVKITGKTTVIEKAAGTGNGAQTSGDATALKGQFTQPTATLSPPSAGGGGSSIDGSAKITGTFGFQLGIGIFGGLLIVAGIFGAVKLGWSGETLLGCVGVGFICIARAIFPVWGEILMVGALLAAVIFWLKASHYGAAATKAFKSSVNRIDFLRAKDPAIASAMAKAADARDAPPLTPLAEKIIKSETVT